MGLIHYKEDWNDDIDVSNGKDIRKFAPHKSILENDLAELFIREAIQNWALNNEQKELFTMLNHFHDNNINFSITALREMPKSHSQYPLKSTEFDQASNTGFIEDEIDEDTVLRKNRRRVGQDLDIFWQQVAKTMLITRNDMSIHDPLTYTNEKLENMDIKIQVRQYSFQSDEYTQGTIENKYIHTFDFNNVNNYFNQLYQLEENSYELETTYFDPELNKYIPDTTTFEMGRDGSSFHYTLSNFIIANKNVLAGGFQNDYVEKINQELSELNVPEKIINNLQNIILLSNTFLESSLDNYPELNVPEKVTNSPKRKI